MWVSESTDKYNRPPLNSLVLEQMLLEGLLRRLIVVTVRPHRLGPFLSSKCVGIAGVSSSFTLSTGEATDGDIGLVSRLALAPAAIF